MRVLKMACFVNGRLSHGPSCKFPVGAGCLHFESFPKHELINVPGEEMLCPRLIRFLPGILNDYFVEWRAAVFGVREFDFPGQNDYFVLIIKGDIPTLITTRSALLAL